MRVVHLATIDRGGAYTAAERYHKCMQRRGIASGILVRTKCSEESDAECVFHNSTGELLSKARNVINACMQQGDIRPDPLGTDVSHLDKVVSADVIMIHWVQSFISLRGIEELAKSDRPVVLVMHDTWAFTGGCHCNLGCMRYETGCGLCPQIRAGSRSDHDISAKLFEKKKRVIRDNGIYLTGPGKWVVQSAIKSGVTEPDHITYIPDTVDTDVFYPIKAQHDDQGCKILRDSIGLNPDKKVILFGAADSGTENVNKGFGYLVRAFDRLDPKSYQCLIFGNGSVPKDITDRFEVHSAGYIVNEDEMNKIYNLADVYVTPSLQETFGLTVCEAMAAGIPVTAFPTGGICDQIDHEINGYLAKDRDPDSLAEGIGYCIENKERLGSAARESVVKRFSMDIVSDILADYLKKITGMENDGRQ